MTTISAKIIADSISQQGVRLTTMQLRYPRMIHSEFMTHRVFSRNARSSRAVPVKTMIQEVIDDPVIPIHWGAAQSGMQAYQECDAPLLMESMPFRYLTREKGWLWARDRAVAVARAFVEAGYAKQLINRLLEPFLHIDTLCTATDWENFFALRDHHAAEPHIQALARAMKAAMAASEPKLLIEGEWHLPFIDEDRDWDTIIKTIGTEEWKAAGGIASAMTDKALKISVARCARISYAPFDGDGSIDAELRRYDLLVGSAPIHASPAEHQATPDIYVSDKAMVKQWRHPELHGNLTGWRQFRKSLPNECIRAIP